MMSVTKLTDKNQEKKKTAGKLNETDALIACFQDTLKISATLGYDTAKNVRVYPENFRSDKKYGNRNAEVTFEGNSTFAEAKNQCSFGKVAVLNFANPHYPGGGVCTGAKAQEESLCRCSNLYVSLNTPENLTDFYGYNQSTNDKVFTDRIIYSRNITVFKDDDLNTLDRKDRFFADVITCAAPFADDRKYVNKTVVKSLFKKRIINIFEVARENEVDILILGAFGCGAFKNPPDAVADAFKEVIEENEYKKCFDKIVFAVKYMGYWDDNYAAFNKLFGTRLWENRPSFELPEIVLPSGSILKKTTVEFPGLLSDTSLDEVKDMVAKGEGLHIGRDEEYEEQKKFLRWQRKNPYYKKQFSILGDSLSTLEGYNPKGYHLFYEGEKQNLADVHTMSDTWWGKVIECFGGELLVNNAWSDSRVTALPDADGLFPAGCSDERTGGLHLNTVLPDVIIVYLGTNDWACGVPYSDAAMLGNDNDLTRRFDCAYHLMLQKIKHNYPLAEIWCCTLNPTYMSDNASFVFPTVINGSNITVFNKIIRGVAENAGCKSVDLYAYQTPYDTIDGSHPNKQGMYTLATTFIRGVLGDEIPEVPQTTVSAEPTNAADEVESADERDTLFPQSKIADYINLTPDSTINLFDPENGVKLYDKKSNAQTVIKETDFYIGSDEDCGLSIAGAGEEIEKKHARIVFDKQSWFIADCDSANGTFLNGEKMQSGKWYMLHPDDEISLAQSYIYCFYKTPMAFIEPLSAIVSDEAPPVHLNAARQDTDKKTDDNYPTEKEIHIRFTLNALIGHGAFGDTYLASNRLGTRVIVRVCDKGVGDWNALVRNNVLQEAMLLKNFNHPDIPKLWDIVEDEEKIYIVKEYFEGDTLDRWLEKQGKPSEKTAVEIAVKIAEVLKYLHNLSPAYIHRDVKPKNIILTPANEIKLVDMDVAVAYIPDKDVEICLGTPGFAPPEQYTNRFDTRVDIFGLGATLFYLLTGVNPNGLSSNLNPFANPLMFAEHGFSDDLKNIIVKCTKNNPDERYRTMEELAEALRALKYTD